MFALLKRLIPGRQISARSMNRALAAVEETDRPTGLNVLINRGAGGIQLRLAQAVSNPHLWIRLTAAYSAGKYAWTEQLRATDDSWTDDADGLSGDLSTLPAYEVNGNAGIHANPTTGTVVRAWLALSGEALLFEYGGSPSTGFAPPSGITSTPATLPTNQNDYPLPATALLTVTTTTNINITGIAAPAGPYFQFVTNAGPFTLTLVNQSTSSTAVNRFVTTDGNNLTLITGQTAVLKYDTSVSRWLVYPVVTGAAGTSVLNLTATTNNYPLPAGTTVLQVAPQSAGFSLTGLSGLVPGQQINIVNAGTASFTIPNQSAGSSPGNRFSTSTGGTMTLGSGQAATFTYDGTSAKQAATSDPLNAFSPITLKGILSVLTTASGGPGSILFGTDATGGPTTELVIPNTNDATMGSAPGKKCLIAADNSAGTPVLKFAVGTATTADWKQVYPAAGSITIGSAVSGGTANRVLFIDNSGNLANSAGLAYVDSAQQLTIGTSGVTCNAQFGGSNVAGILVDPSLTFAAYLGATAASVGGSGASGYFSDGTRVVRIADANYAIDVTAGTIRTLGTTGNTYRWENNTTAPSTNAGTPTTRYGGDTNYCGDPDAWVIINIGGTDYKVPAFL